MKNEPCCCTHKTKERTAEETKKLINRGATEFMCVDCLAAHFEVRPEDIEERIRHFKQMGCTLFATTTP